MKTREITSLALKLFALYLLSQALINVPSIMGVYLAIESRNTDNPSHEWLWVSGVVSILCAIVIAILIWKLANKSLIESLKNDSESSDLNIVPTDFERIIYWALGLFFLVSSISSIPFSFYSAYASVNNDLSFGLNTGHILHISSDLFQALIGITLILYPGHWSSLFTQVRRS